MTNDEAELRCGEIERWFVRRGVPQLVVGYSSEPRMDARAAPWIAAWLIVGTLLFWGRNPTWPLWANVAGVAGTLVVAAFGFLAIRRFRGLSLRRRTLGVLEILLLAAFVAIPAAVIDASPLEALAAWLNALLGIGVIYLVVGFGLPEIAQWAIGRIASELAQIVGLIGRTLPLLLILVVFLLFAAEIWEAAHGLSGLELAAVLALLALIAAVLVVSTFRRELATLERSIDRDRAIDKAVGSPARAADEEQSVQVPLGWLERVNLAALVLIGVLLQAIFVALVVMAFLVVFGLLVIPIEIQEGWIRADVTVLARFALLAEERALSWELVAVSSVLSGIVGLYFAGLAVTDRGHRADYFERMLDEVRQLLSVRADYRQLLGAANTMTDHEADPDPAGAASRTRRD